MSLKNTGVLCGFTNLFHRMAQTPPFTAPISHIPKFATACGRPTPQLPRAHRWEPSCTQLKTKQLVPSRIPPPFGTTAYNRVYAREAEKMSRQ